MATPVSTSTPAAQVPDAAGRHLAGRVATRGPASRVTVDVMSVPPPTVPSGDEPSQAEIAEAIERHRAWVAAGRPGAVPHVEARRILLSPRAD